MDAGRLPSGRVERGIALDIDSSADRRCAKQARAISKDYPTIVVAGNQYHDRQSAMPSYCPCTPCVYRQQEGYYPWHSKSPPSPTCSIRSRPRCVAARTRAGRTDAWSPSSAMWNPAVALDRVLVVWIGSLAGSANSNDGLRHRQTTISNPLLRRGFAPIGRQSYQSY